jgi:hypothetical protein
MPEFTTHTVPAKQVRIRDAVVAVQSADENVTLGKALVEKHLREGGYLTVAGHGYGVRKDGSDVVKFEVALGNYADAEGLWADAVDVQRFHVLADSVVTVLRWEPTAAERAYAEDKSLREYVEARVRTAQSNIREFGEKVSPEGEFSLSALLHAVKWGKVEDLVEAELIVEYGQMVLKMYGEATDGRFSDALDYVEARAALDARFEDRPMSSKSTNGWSNAVEDEQGRVRRAIANGALRRNSHDLLSSKFDDIKAARERLGLNRD